MPFCNGRGAAAECHDPDTDDDSLSDGPLDPDGDGPICAGPDPAPLNPDESIFADTSASPQQLTGSSFFTVEVQMRRTDTGAAMPGERNITLHAAPGGRFLTQRIHAGSERVASTYHGRFHGRTDLSGRLSIEAFAAEDGLITMEDEGGYCGIPASSSAPELRLCGASFVSAEWYGAELLFPTGENQVGVDLADLIETRFGLPASDIAPQWQVGALAFEQIRVGRQGWVQLGDGPPLASLPSIWSDAPVGFLAPFCAPLATTQQTRVLVDFDFGVEPFLVVQWQHMGHVSEPGADLTFQLRLMYDSRQAIFAYRDMRASSSLLSGTGALVGMKLGPAALHAWTGPMAEHRGLRVITPSAPAIEVQSPHKDGDGLALDQEAMHGTDANDWDTDSDGMSDGWEVERMPLLNPVLDDAQGDADCDGLKNIIEFYMGTDPSDSNDPDPTVPDTDQDGMPDAWELAYGLNLGNPSDALVDSDGDGYANVLEYAIGGDPTSRTDHGEHPAEPNGGATRDTYPGTPSSPTSRIGRASHGDGMPAGSAGAGGAPGPWKPGKVMLPFIIETDQLPSEDEFEFRLWDPGIRWRPPSGGWGMQRLWLEAPGEYVLELWPLRAILPVDHKESLWWGFRCGPCVEVNGVPGTDESYFVWVDLDADTQPVSYQIEALQAEPVPNQPVVCPTPSVEGASPGTGWGYTLAEPDFSTVTVEFVCLVGELKLRLAGRVGWETIRVVAYENLLIPSESPPGTTCPGAGTPVLVPPEQIARTTIHESRHCEHYAALVNSWNQQLADGIYSETFPNQDFRTDIISQWEADFSDLKTREAAHCAFGGEPIYTPDCDGNPVHRPSEEYPNGTCN